MKIFEKIIYIFNKYAYTITFTLLTVSIIILICSVNKNSKDDAQKKEEAYQTIDCERSKYATVPIKSVRLMTDLNESQLQHARANGLKNIYITNQAFIEDSARLAQNYILKKIKNNSLYLIKNLTHSYPYVTLETADLIDDIATVFHEKLENQNLNHYLFYVTSALRTAEFQEDLTGRNRNAANESAHLYGTTVDISYKEFFNTQTGKTEQNYLVADALRKTILDLREACKMVVVREKKQACYHFTVVNCDPEKNPDILTLE